MAFVKKYHHDLATAAIKGFTMREEDSEQRKSRYQKASLHCGNFDTCHLHKVTTYASSTEFTLMSTGELTLSMLLITVPKPLPFAQSWNTQRQAEQRSQDMVCHHG